jgi:RNA polymerase sigma-70 factor (ECF subfamily)
MLAHDVLGELEWPAGPSGSAGHCLLAGDAASVRVVGGNDAFLAARLAAGDDHALAEIFDRLVPAVYGGALRVLGNGAAAQDVVQEVFVQLWSHPDRYDPAAGSLRSYLIVLARHRAVDVLRSELRRVARQERSYQLTREPLARSACEEAMATEAAGLVRDAVRALPAGQRQVVELAYFAGLSCREVAREAGIPEGTAKSRLRLARARLEATLDRELLGTTTTSAAPLGCPRRFPARPRC